MNPLLSFTGEAQKTEYDVRNIAGKLKHLYFQVIN